jgi:hypothetical protein
MSTSNSNLPTFLQKARAEASDIMNQLRDYLTEKYKQAGQVFSLSSAYGQILHAFTEISNMILFYIEDSVTELNIFSASRKSSIQGLARLAGHSATRIISASGEVEIALFQNPNGINGNQILIPRYSRIQCVNNNLVYILDIPDQEVRIPFSSTSAVYARVVQGEIQTQIYTADGTSLQSYSIQERSFNYIDNFYIKVYVNGEEWKSYDSLYDIPRDAKGYVAKTGIAGGLDIYFGNGPFGLIPVLGSEIRIEYLRSTGSNGNLREGDLVYFSWIDPGYSLYNEQIDLNEITNVKMSRVISFGSDGEDVELTRKIAPKTSRSYVFANPDNYIIFLSKFNYFSVIDAYTTWNDEYIDDDNIIYLFLVPDITKRLTQGENYFTVSQQYFTLTSQEKDKVLSLIEDSGQKIVTTVVKIVDPLISKYVMNVSLVTYDGYSTQNIRSQVIDEVSNYFLSTTRRDRIPKSDLIKVIENIEGVDSVNVSFIGEANEAKVDQTAPLIGLDEFGDIILEKDELPLIRGGWTDHNGVYYQDGIQADKPSSLNIEFKKTTKKRTSY